jgi:hypothetical protein
MSPKVAKASRLIRQAKLNYDITKVFLKKCPPNKRPSLFFSDKENSCETMRLGSVVGCFEEENVGDECDAEQSDQESPDKETQKFCDLVHLWLHLGPVHLNLLPL